MSLENRFHHAYAVTVQTDVMKSMKPQSATGLLKRTVYI